MKKDSITRLAKILKDRDNPEYLGVLIGIIERPFPNIAVRVDPQVLLEKNRLIFSEQLMTGYERRCRIVTADGAIVGDFSWTEEFKVGDRLILVPTLDDQMYYVMDRAVEFL